ncbi:MAG: carbohydrate ABC transporter permease, partial [Gorillibacterium sp.]|nr:carbohydrate ABC transporter permease [Gorillibacterium sp.]
GLMLFMVRQFFIGIPKELSEAALVDGCSQVKIYYRIILPLAVPALLTMVLFTFIWMWNDYASPQIFITTESRQVLSVGLTSFQTDYGPVVTAQIAAALVGILPSILLFSIFQKHFIQGIASTGVKG